MIERAALKTVRKLAKQFPAVAILGARQVGKTTLAKHIFDNAVYLDLEEPTVRERFLSDTTFAIKEVERMPVIFDEAQLAPPLFSSLRGRIDADRRRNGHFILLGSAHPALIRAVSESLAGRVATVELEPFFAAEIKPASPSACLPRLWLRGGMPDAYGGDFRVWWTAFLNTYVQRDLAVFGLEANPLLLLRLLTMLAHQQGGLVNYSDLARANGVAVHTIQRYMDLLEGTFLIRRLQPYFANVGKRLVKASRCYLRDTGLVHHLLNLNTLDEVRAHPVAGASWETFVLEDVQRRLKLSDPFASCFFWRTADGHEADLLIERGGKPDTLIEVKLGSGADAGAAKRLGAIAQQLGARRAFILSRENGAEMLVPGVERLGPDRFLAEKW